MGRFRFDPDGYLERIRDEIPAYDELQASVAAATAGLDVRRLLDLGAGTGETARRLLELHPEARLTGIDENPRMLERAHTLLPPERVDELTVSRLEDPLPGGPFDLVVSALAVHHLDATGKAALFRRVAGILAPGGRFVLGDVVVPEHAEDAVIELTEGFDLPDRAADQVAWLEAAGLSARVAWSQRDLAVIVGDR